MYIISEGDAAESLFPFVNTSLSPSVAAQLRQSMSINHVRHRKNVLLCSFLVDEETCWLKNQTVVNNKICYINNQTFRIGPGCFCFLN